MSRHLLLVSRGLGAVPGFIETRMASHVDRPVIAFVPTAGDPYENPYWVASDRAELEAFGYEVRDVDLSALNGARLREALQGAHVVFVAGGNAFWLLHQMRRSGFAKLLPHLLDAGVLYVGASAGAIVMGPDIAPTAPLVDSSEVTGLTSTEGLHFVSVVPVPHADGVDPDEAALAKIREAHGHGFHLEWLGDEEAIMVEDDAAAVIESAMVVR